MFLAVLNMAMADATAGGIDNAGLFTASLAAGIYPDAIQATSGSASDTAGVTVVYPHRVYLPVILMNEQH